MLDTTANATDVTANAETTATTATSVAPTTPASQSSSLLAWLNLMPLTLSAAFIFFVILIYRRLQTLKENLAQKHVKEGNSHKLNRQWHQAGQAFEKAASEFWQRERGEHDAASNFAEAANCYRKLKQPEFIQKAVQCLKTASRIYAEVGEFSIAARQLEEAGDLLKSYGDYINSISAIELYQKAADYWSAEDSPANAAGSRSKAAQLMADIDRFGDAAKEFEDLGVSSQQHSLLRFEASGYMFKACLCQMCLDPLRCAEMAENLSRKCDSFTGSDEKALVMKLSDACNAGDAAAFDRALAEFERLNNLDDWSRRRLEPVRQKIAGQSLS